MLTIHLPPLRDRGEDVLLLANHFLTKLAEKTGKKIIAFTDEAQNILRNYKWPGNVRELENTIERALIITNDTIIKPDDLKLEGPSQPSTKRLTLKEHENQILLKTLDQTDGNRTRAAEILDVSTRWIQLRLKELGLNLERG